MRTMSSGRAAASAASIASRTEGVATEPAYGRNAVATSSASYARWVFGRHAYTLAAIGPRAAPIPARSLSFKMPVTKSAFRSGNVSAIAAASASVAGGVWGAATPAGGGVPPILQPPRPPAEAGARLNAPPRSLEPPGGQSPQGAPPAPPVFVLEQP